MNVTTIDVVIADVVIDAIVFANVEAVDSADHELQRNELQIIHRFASHSCQTDRFNSECRAQLSVPQ